MEICESPERLHINELLEYYGNHPDQLDAIDDFCREMKAAPRDIFEQVVAARKLFKRLSPSID